MSNNNHQDIKEAIMTLSPNKGFISGNEETVKLFGCENEKDFISRSPATLSPKFQPDGSLSMEKAQKMMSIALEKGTNFFEWSHTRADGTEFLATVFLTKLPPGGEAKLQAIVRKITDLRKL
jgi:hypothetical protein